MFKLRPDCSEAQVFKSATDGIGASHVGPWTTGGQWCQPCKAVSEVSVQAASEVSVQGSSECGECSECREVRVRRAHV